MESIKYIERTTGKIEEEQVYGASALHLLYGDHWFCRFFGSPLKTLISRFPFFSKCFGWWNKQSFTKSKIRPFIKKFNVDVTEFLDPIDSFSSFNEFFIRRLKPECRPIAGWDHKAIIPADGRYLFFQNIAESKGFWVKGKKFTIQSLLKNKILAKKYEQGTMLIARLCPTDYHRFHFPVDCIPGETHVINGPLYSVNPIATKGDIEIFSKNKRTICELETKFFGKVLMVEVGATCVGSIVQTYKPKTLHHKGDEKGYFEFGGSSLIILFEPNRLQLPADLVAATKKGLEVRCLMGQSIFS